MKRRVSEYWLYKYRYIFSYVLALLAIVTGLILAALYVPSGLRQAEMSAAVLSGSLTFNEFDPASVINLPYHMLQRASIELLGVGEFSLKLPSVILGLLAVIGMFQLIKEWFRKNVAVITAFLTATLPSFIFITQDATSQIFPIAVSIWLLVAGTHVTRRRSPRVLWKIAFSLLLALNMYTPLGIYLNIAVISTIIFHPHIRHLSRKLSINRIAVSVGVALILLAPLMYSLVMQPHLGLWLLGIPSEKPDILVSATELGKSFVWQTGSTEGVYRPLFSIGVLVIMIIGFIRFLQVKYTARSYIIWLWSLLLLPFLILNPDLAILSLPLAMLMIAMGMNTLIAEWYKLFPYNPYARVLGLIPLSVIVVGIVLSSATRYTYHYHYNPELMRQFSVDTRLLKKTLTRANADAEQPVTVVVRKDQLAYYKLLAQYDTRFTATDNTAKASRMPFVLANGVRHTAQTQEMIPNYISVNDRKQASARFYLYTEKMD